MVHFYNTPQNFGKCAQSTMAEDFELPNRSFVTVKKLF